MKIVIYGLFRPSGECFYVGSTVAPKQRANGHAKRFGTNFILAPLAVATSESEAVIKEQRWIDRMLSEGEALENKVSARSLRDNRPMMFRILETGEEFAGRLELAARLEYNPTSVSNWIKTETNGVFVAWDRAFGYKSVQVAILSKTDRREPEKLYAIGYTGPFAIAS